MKIKCPLCRLNDLQNLEFENYDELVWHCEQEHTVKALAGSFIENYFAHKELREKIHEKIEENKGHRDDTIPALLERELKSLLENDDKK